MYQTLIKLVKTCDLYRLSYLIKYIKIEKSKTSNEPQKCVIGVWDGVYFTLPGVGGVVRAAGISVFPPAI